MKGLTILLVDDVAFTLEMEKRTLERTGCSILTANNGDEALEIISHTRPDLILMDIYMPGMKGDECCKKIKETPEYSNIPVLFTTSATKEDAVQMCATSGCDGVIYKPFKGHELFREIRKFVNLGEREQIRVLYSGEVVFETNGAGHSGQIHDISSGGLFIETKYLLHKGDIVNISFSLPEGDIHTEAEVVRVVESGSLLNSEMGLGFGVHFIHLSEAEQTAINDHVYGL